MATAFTLSLLYSCFEKKKIDLQSIWYFLSSKQLWARWCWPQQCLIHKWLLDDGPLPISWSDWYKLALLIILGIFLVINQPSQL